MPRFLNSDYVHQHVHSEMSKFDGLAKIAKLVMKARQMGFPAIALTDHGTVGGWIKLIAECEREKDKDGNKIPFPTIKPILGEEFYLARDHKWHGIEAARKANKKYSGPNYQPDRKKGNRHLVLTAKNWQGYQNICRLSEKSWVEGVYHNPRIDIELLAQHSEGVMCQSACLSSVINSCLLHDRYDLAKRSATILKDIFGDDFYLEAMFHGIDAEGMIIPEILKLGAELGIPVIATNDVHYTEQPQALSQEVLMAISTKKCMHDDGHLKFPYAEFYLKSADEMGKIFGAYPELIYNTLAIAEKVDATGIKKSMGGMRLPDFPLPSGFNSTIDYMEHLAWEGLKKCNWDRSQRHIDCLKKELADIRIAKENNDYDFAKYFLMKWDMIRQAKEKKILVGCGRGSVFASLLARTLGITYGPDPTEHGLFWERFLGFDFFKFMKESDFGLEVTDSVVDLAAVMDDAEERAEEVVSLDIEEPEFSEEEEALGV